MPDVTMNAGMKVDVRNTVDTKKIMEKAQKAACNILVGFPGGMQHVPTIHKKKGKKAKYKTIDGGGVETVKPVETAELAKMLHFGGAGIPARPFLDEGLAKKKNDLKKAMEQEAAKAVNGGQPNWDKVGTMAVGAINEFVRGDHYKATVPNSPRTIEYKGSDKPLIDGANMIQSLQYIVQKDGKK